MIYERVILFQQIHWIDTYGAVCEYGKCEEDLNKWIWIHFVDELHYKYEDRIVYHFLAPDFFLSEYFLSIGKMLGRVQGRMLSMCQSRKNNSMTDMFN